jgi:ribosome-binding protein aMBF1 (putative translation factor)
LSMRKLLQQSAPQVGCLQFRTQGGITSSMNSVSVQTAQTFTSQDQRDKLTPQKVRHLLAKNLKALRKAKGLSQNDLARKAYMSQESVSRYECGRCGLSVEAAVVFAQALGVEVADILEGTL